MSRLALVCFENSAQCHLMHAVETAVESISNANMPSAPILPGYPVIKTVNWNTLLHTNSRPENASMNGIFNDVTVAYWRYLMKTYSGPKDIALNDVNNNNKVDRSFFSDC